MNGRLKKLVAIFMLFLHIISLADGIVPDSAASRNLQVDKAANGVPLVNIEHQIIMELLIMYIKTIM